MSTTSSIPLWGQAWELTVQYSTEGGGTSQAVLTSDSWDPDALRMTFEVLQTTLPSPWWFADICIYNMNKAEIQNTLLNATWVILKAGFQTGPSLFATIWDGPVLQPMFDREDVVDFKVTLHCVANPLVLNDIVSFSIGQFASQQLTVARMANEAGLPDISVDNGTMSQATEDRLAGKQYPRGKTVFGKVNKELRQIADDQFVNTWCDGNKAYIAELSAGKTIPQPDLVYSPPFPPNYQVSGLPSGTTQSIIGTPRQTPFGVIFTVLLDPRLKVQMPPLVVQLVRTLISQIAAIPGQNLVSPMSANLNFFVAQVRHSGDTRGNEWQTEVTGYNTSYASGLFDKVFAATAGGK